MTYKINFEAYSNNFAVPQEIIDSEFDKLDPNYLKVILLIFKNSSKNYSSNLLSNLLNIDEVYIDKAISFWIEKGILLTEKLDINISDTPAFLLSKKPSQATIIQKSASVEIAYLVESMEEKLKRPVTPMEYKTILHILEFIKLPADVVIMAIGYCISIDKANARYIEKICTVWADAGITTHEKAEQYLTMLEQSKQNEQKIKQILGISDRVLIDSEKEFISRWLNEYKFDFELIKLAYEKTILSINKLSFPYMNKILSTWYEKGIKTLLEINNDQQGATKPTKPKVSDASYDIDEIDKFWDSVPKLT